MNILKRGDEVAILPQQRSLPHDVLDIAKIVFVGPRLIEVANGRIYFASNGKSVHAGQDDYIVPAMEEHRRAWQAKLH